MTQSEILEGVRGVVGDLFGVDSAEITMETTRDSVDGWDSLQHVNVILDLESLFDVHFSEAQIARMQDVKTIVEIIAEQQK